MLSKWNLLKILYISKREIEGEGFKLTYNNITFSLVSIYHDDSYDNSGNVPVRICTTWLQEKKEESVDHDPFYLEDAMTTDTLLNITMKAGWKLLGDAEQAKIDQNRYWEIGKASRKIVHRVLKLSQVKLQLQIRSKSCRKCSRLRWTRIQTKTLFKNF